MKQEVYFNGEPYVGYAGFIYGYNGYESSKDDGMLCAIIGGSCWGEDGVPNMLTDKKGNAVVNKNLRGRTIMVNAFSEFVFLN